MVDSNHKEIRTSLEPRDEDDIAVMEGRLPASDQPEDRNSANAIFNGVESESEQHEHVTASKPGGGNVVTIPSRQPWMKMAAALVVGVMVTALFDTWLQVPESGSSGDLGIASANVAYLEVLRGDNADLPEVRITDDPWITLVASPDFANATQIRVSVEREATPQEGWIPVLYRTVGVGTKDSIVVNLESGSLQRGLYRLRVESNDGERSPVTTSMMFLVN